MDDPKAQYLQHLVIHLEEGDEEWFEVYDAGDGLIFIKEDWLDKLCRMIPGYSDHVIIPADHPSSL